MDEAFTRIKIKIVKHESSSLPCILHSEKKNTHVVRKLLLKLNVTKASGPDQISNWFLKECADSLCT